MASTNKTTNYELSQFIGTDKPAWLSDYNTDMSKIDTAVKNAADTATSASGTATSASTAVGDLTSLTTTVKTSAVAAINEVNTATGTAQGTADTAVTAAATNATKIQGLQNYLTLTQFTNPTATASGATITAQSLNCASNATGSLGKVYGDLRITGTGSSHTVTFASPLRPSTALTINGGLLAYYFDGTNWVPVAMSFSVGTDGKITVTIGGSTSGRQWRLIFINSIIFAVDFGDVPLPQ